MIWFLQNEIQKIQNNPVNIAIVCTSACVALILTSILSALASASASPKYEFPQTFSKTSTTIQKSESYPLRRREYGFVFCFKHTFNFFFRNQTNQKQKYEEEKIVDVFPSQLSRYTSDGYTVNLIPSMVAGALGVVGQNRILFLRYFFHWQLFFQTIWYFRPQCSSLSWE